MKKVLKRILGIKLALFAMLFSVSIVYAVVSGTKIDGLWKWEGGHTISATQMNENFEFLLNRIKELEKAQVPSKAIMAFNSTCPANWIPADGTAGTPDLRGVFVRGKNNFGSPEGDVSTKTITVKVNGVDVEFGPGKPNGVWGDPEGSLRGVPWSRQADSLQGHSHNINGDYGIGLHGYSGGNIWHRMVGSLYNAGSQSISKPISDGDNGNPRFFSETRVKNVALIYCMKQ